MSIDVYRARPEEYDAIGALQVAVNRATYGARAEPWVAFVGDIARRATEGEMLVAREDGEIVGAAAFVPDETSLLAEGMRPGEAGIRLLVVDPARSRRGVGEALSRACIDRARAAGKAAVMLHAVVDQAPACRLYEKLGFTPTPTRDRLAGDGGTLVCYVLALAGDA